MKALRKNKKLVILFNLKTDNAKETFHKLSDAYMINYIYDYPYYYLDNINIQSSQKAFTLLMSFLAKIGEAYKFNVNTGYDENHPNFDIIEFEEAE